MNTNTNAREKIVLARTTLLFNMPRDNDPCMKYKLVAGKYEPTYKFVGDQFVYNPDFINRQSDPQIIQIFLDECY